jgi:hypothetical protein
VRVQVHQAGDDESPAGVHHPRRPDRERPAGGDPGDPPALDHQVPRRVTGAEPSMIGHSDQHRLATGGYRRAAIRGGAPGHAAAQAQAALGQVEDRAIARDRGDARAAPSGSAGASLPVPSNRARHSRAWRTGTRPSTVHCGRAASPACRHGTPAADSRTTSA